MNRKGYLLIAHGSRNESAAEEVRVLASEISARLNGAHVCEAFLEQQRPTIEDAFISLTEQKGCSEVVVLLHFLNSGKHVLTDVPDHLNRLQEKYPEIRIENKKPLGFHQRIPDLYLDIIG